MSLNEKISRFVINFDLRIFIVSRWNELISYFYHNERRKHMRSTLLECMANSTSFVLKTKRKSAKQILSLLNKKYKSYVLLQDTACIQNHYQSCYFDRIIPNNFTHIIIRRTKYYMIYFGQLYSILIDRYCTAKSIMSKECHKSIIVTS